MPDPYKTRISLINRLKELDDNQSWDEFVTIYQGYIYTVIRNMNINEADRDELVQQVMIKLWEKIPALDSTGKKGRFRSWLSTVTRNCVIDYIRKRNRQMALMDKVTQEKERDYLNSVQVPASDLFEDESWRMHLTNKALDNIRPHFSDNAIQSFRLSLQGMEAQEIAETLDVKPESVYRLKTRVKASLIAEVKRLRAELE
ncbi:RNA polymerase sigma factor [Persicirhabdus sediminis]|uniref:Sigma-70 family RNA polymerase sigma factor n=1 Tax=Persicirhabdus sediminis TaxID=454144 RepID=A0A8J7MF01_9BACT|nr:sigma-70 family RNA polymerase sigma factor [Persicirhabdus sediminis]MBK1792141.1 sigma-70 family RNA polymerase sigma factor [Persicirhabdus sediminis]